MKKVLAFVISVIMILSALCCGAMAEAVDVSGEWYADMFGMPIVMVLTDGVYSLDLAGELNEGTYRFDGASLCMDEGTEAEMQMPYDAERNVFILDLGDGMVTEFSREMIAAFTPAAARTDAAIEEFEGIWSTVQVSAFGMVMPPEVIGMNVEALVLGTTVDLCIDLMGDITEAAVEGTLADGALSVMIPGSEGSGDLLIAMKLLEDGMLETGFEMLGETVTFYMEQPVALEETAE